MIRDRVCSAKNNPKSLFDLIAVLPRTRVEMCAETIAHGQCVIVYW